MFQLGEKNLENVTHEEAVATLKATHERVNLLIGKFEPALRNSTNHLAHHLTSDVPSSPNPCELSKGNCFFLTRIS